MPRARSLKPSFFTHEKLCELSPLHRILFEGLWCWADKRGVLEDRPRFLKTVILPYDDCDVNAMLNDLASKGFVVGYRVGEQRMLFVPKFVEHQHIHVDEKKKPDKLPGHDAHGAIITRGITPVCDDSVRQPEKPGVSVVDTSSKPGCNTPLICNPSSVICNLEGADEKASPPPPQELFPESEITKTPKPKKPPASELKALQVAMEAVWLEIRGVGYLHKGAADTEALKRARASVEDETILLLWRSAVASNDKWLRAQSIAEFVSKLNEHIDRARGGGQKRVGL